jgi:hypothetical protein
VLTSKLHRLWRRLDKRVFQSLFGGRGSQPPHYFYSVAELNEHTIDGGRERQHMLPVSSIVPGRQFTPIMSESPHSTTLSITTEDFEGAVKRERWLVGASGYWDLPRHPPAASCRVQQCPVIQAKERHRSVMRSTYLGSNPGTHTTSWQHRGVPFAMFT